MMKKQKSKTPKKKMPLNEYRLPNITRTEVTNGSIQFRVERGDKTYYEVHVSPHDNDILLSFSFIGDKVIKADPIHAANNITVRIADNEEKNK